MKKLNVKIASVVVLLLLSTGFLNAQSLKKDKALGEKGFEMVKNTMGLYDDAAMTAYLNKVGQRLVSQLDSSLFEYHFYIVNEKSPNAFALPGGYIFITTGIIPIIENEDELACIIGHEIIHSNNRHTIRQTRKRIIPVMLTLPIDILGVFAPGVNSAMAPVKASQQLLFASYSRKFETEADDQGIALAAKAGYDPHALPKVLSRMMKAIEWVTGQRERKNYFSDHPFTPDRNANIQEQIKDITINPTPAISKDFLREFDGIAFGDSPSQGIIRDEVFIHPDLDLYIKYPHNWKIKNMDTVVAAMSPQRDAAFALSLANPKMTAKEAGKNYEKSLSKRYKKMLFKSEAFKVNDNEGYLVGFQEIVFGDTTFAYVLYLPIAKQLYKITAMANDEERTTLLKIAKSIRTLTDVEKQSVLIKYIKVVNSKEGETFDELSKRTGNKIKPGLTAIINAHKEDDKLKEGSEIKIVSEKTYSPK